MKNITELEERVAELEAYEIDVAVASGVVYSHCCGPMKDGIDSPGPRAEVLEAIRRHRKRSEEMEVSPIVPSGFSVENEGEECWVVKNEKNVVLRWRLDTDRITYALIGVPRNVVPPFLWAIENNKRPQHADDLKIKNESFIR